MLVLTGIIGYLCGAWLYLTVFVPEYIENPYLNKLIAENTPVFTINAEEYGECGPYDDCRAFSVEGNKTYRYQDYRGDFYDGQLSTVQVNNILAALENGTLAGRDEVCFDYEKNHTRYSIYYNENYYVIEACDGSSPLEPVATFNTLWQFFLTESFGDTVREERGTSTPIFQSPTEVIFGEN